MAVRMGDFEKAMKAAFNGPDNTHVKIERHDFNVDKAIITKSGNKTIVEGSDGNNISHRLRFRPDDQVIYGFEKQGGVISDLEVEIKKGGVVSLVKKVIVVIEIAKEIFDAVKEDGKSDAQANDAAFQETKRLLDGSWEGEARFMIANIALRA